MSYLIWNYSNDHNENGNQWEPPVKEPWRWFKNSDDFENYELKKRQRQSECNGEDELNAKVFDFIVLKQLLHEEDKTTAKE